MAQNQLPRLSGKEFIIMNLLIRSRAEMYGLELVNKAEGSLKNGSIYVLLGRLEDKGYIASRREEEQPGARSIRRLYKPTGLGVRVFRALESAGGKAWLREAMA